MTTYAKGYSYAQFANLAYKNYDKNQVLGDWKVVSTDSDEKSGFRAYAFRNEQTTEVVISYRGTNAKNDITGADAAFFGVREWDQQFTEAVRFAADVRREFGRTDTIAVTGHSLGGAMAQVAGQMFGFGGAAFEPGGAKNLVTAAEFKQLAAEYELPSAGKGIDAGFNNYYIPGSIVSNLSGEHVGSMVALTGLEGTLSAVLSFQSSFLLGLVDQYCKHKMDNIEKLMKAAADREAGIPTRWENFFQQQPIIDGNSTAVTYNKVITTSFLAARTVAPARRDPLVLDLDGDGLETVGIDTQNPILFDHDGDGVKTATGWVTPDDAFLVLERNDDGRIDSGSELFGDATPLAAGTTAADGFAALAQEDTNSDGLVNASDERFANLRLWRDANQDGISQANELITLASQDISALKVGRTANSTLLANGNQIADLGGFVRNDGSDGTLGAVEQLADINLASSPFYSEFTDSIPLTEQAQTLPELQGAGMVRSLRQAASLPTDQGRELATQLVAFAAETTRSGQMAKLDSLLKAWAETSSMATTASGAFAGINLTLTFAGATKDTPAWQTWLNKLSILERFNGQTFLPVPAAGSTLVIDFYTTREALLEASYTALRESVYGALVMQTRLKPYLDQISLSINENGIALDFSAMEAANDNQRRTWA